MTLLTEKAATESGTPATDNAKPSAGAADVKAGEQKAASKEPQANADKAEPDAGQKKGGDAGEKPTGAPETYEFKFSDESLKLGEVVETAYTEAARELNLTNEAAQKLLDKVTPALAAQTQANIAEMVQAWEDETKADPKIGGAKLKENLALAQKALDLGPPELRTLLGPVKNGGTGLGNHKAIIAWAAEIGRRLSNDTFVAAGGNSGKSAPKTLGDALYGS